MGKSRFILAKIRKYTFTASKTIIHNDNYRRKIKALATDYDKTYQPTNSY